MAEMKIFIYSRKAMEKLLKSDFPENVASSVFMIHQEVFVMQTINL